MAKRGRPSKGPRKSVKFRARPLLMQRLEALADAEGLPVSEVIERILDGYFVESNHEWMKKIDHVHTALYGGEEAYI
jgi:hypothetical protein